MRRAGAYKPEHRDVAKFSVRLMLSDLTGMLCVSSLIGDNVPSNHYLCSSRAGGGLLLGRKALVKVLAALVDDVDYLPNGSTMNIHDMACMYSTEHGFSIINKEKGLVLRDDMSVSHDTRYSI